MFTGLAKFANGKQIVYTITEDAVAGYTTTYDGYNVTNAHLPESTFVSGSKIWQDNNNQDGIRPESITIRLWADGVEIASQVVTAAENWTWQFAGLEKFANGKQIVYAITEDAVEGYTTTYDGYNVTNTYVPEVRSISVDKIWDDQADFDGKRPESITIRLYADGVEVASRVLTAADGWKCVFENLAVYANGQQIHYTISEDAVAEYTLLAVEGDAELGFRITNQHVVEPKGEEPPKTGDPIFLAMAMATVSMLCVLLLASYRKKRA